MDFNQGLDARLIDDPVAHLLSKLKWIRFIRLSCDTMNQLPIVQKAVTLLRWYNANPAQIFVYCLVQDVAEALERVKALNGLYLTVFVQLYRDFEMNTEPLQELKNFARWVNRPTLFKSVDWTEYQRTTPANGIKLCVVRSHTHKPALNRPALGMARGVSGIVNLFGGCSGIRGSSDEDRAG